MTREEAIKEFESELKWAELNIYPYVSKQKIEANKMAIKALEQETVSKEAYNHEYFLRKEFELKIYKLQRQLEEQEQSRDLIVIITMEIF